MAATELAAGTVIGGRYRVERRLGEGGMGVVWAAEDVTTGERSAVKLMKAADDPEARRRFLREGRAAAAVRHPNVVRILDVLELDDGSPAIAMELLEGETLRDLLAREPKLALAPLLDILVPVISAVGAAHALGVVHRDLKPENIFLSEGPGGERVVKVLDFGIAKLTALDGEAARSTGITTGAVLGTPAYMAPEQVFGERDIDHLADVWAIGLLCYQCVSGILPTQGENVGQVLKNVLARPFDPLDQLVAGFPSEVSDVVARMLARERSERPTDLREPFEILGKLAQREAPGFGPPAAPLTTSPARRAAALGDTEPAFGLDRRLATPSRTPRPSQPAPPPVAPEPPRRGRLARPRAAVAAGLVGLIGLGLAGAAALWLREGPDRTAPPASPLALPSAKLACPVARASISGRPAGWLGAAAAAIACERASILLGGRAERTLVPADLLDLSSEPLDRYRADLYGQPDARDRSLTAAQQRAQAYLDGDVTGSSSGFTVELALHRASGSEIARGSGRGRALYEAVREAMAPLVATGLIPKAAALVPDAAAWSRTDDVDAGLAALDLSFAFAHNAGGLPDECRRFAEVSPRVAELGPDGQWICAYTLGRSAPEVTLPAADPSPAGVATRIRINHSIHHVKTPGDLDVLRRLLEREPSARGRSLIAATASCLLGSGDPAAAREMALVAVQSDPRNPVGGWCNPWDQLMTLERDTTGGEAAIRAMQAWLPWSSYAWLEPGFASAKQTSAVLELLRRAHLLSPFDTQIAGTLADSLLGSGDRTAARGIAGALRAGGLPIHALASDLILVRVETSEARFGAALDKARKASELLPGDAGWVRAQRFEIAWRALELAILLGRAREIADLIVARFLEPEPSPLDSNAALVPFRIPAVCALASAPAPCFARFRALRHQLPGAITQDTDDFMTGAERYVKRDFAGAARAWRPRLGGRMVLASVLPGAMVDVFDRTGASNLAEQLDAEVMKRAPELNGATLGHVRAAHRALSRGDRRTAQQLADQVIAAWSVADELPPAVAEMRRLVSARGP